MENIKDYSSLIDSLEGLGLKNSMYSARFVPILAVAVYISRSNEAVYILLDERMTSREPRMSWINSRKQVMTQEELIEKTKELIKKYNVTL
jgi:hypothetical protein